MFTVRDEQAIFPCGMISAACGIVVSRNDEKMQIWFYVLWNKFSMAKVEFSWNFAAYLGWVLGQTPVCEVWPGVCIHDMNKQ